MNKHYRLTVDIELETKPGVPDEKLVADLLDRGLNRGEGIFVDETTVFLIPKAKPQRKS